MIDFKISPRGSGKTSELIKMYKENPGIFIVTSISRTAQIHSLDKTIKAQLPSNFKILGYKKGQWFYFDEFFDQYFIDFKDIIHLDELGYNVVIRGTPQRIPPGFKEFKLYLKEHWPECLV